MLTGTVCGIVAFVARPGRFTREHVKAATDALAHRGPDGARVVRAYANAHWEVWLGHRRLAVVDLSDASAQPLRAQTQGGWIVHNGEIYNFRDLTPEVAARIPMRSRGDAEVLLGGLLTEGPSFLGRTNGMFALAAVDERRDQLLLARDRMGKKPLYVYEGDDFYAFASELKAFSAAGLPLTPDPTSLAYYRWLGYVPATRAIFRGCTKLPAGSWARMDLASPTKEPLRPQTYWDPVAACGRRFEGGFDDAADELGALLDDATKIRLAADVPVGVFLSGGIDSSVVAASVARAGADCVAYVIKPDDPAMDESARALRTAATLGLQARVLHLHVADYDRQLERLAWSFDEPLASTSQLAVAALAERARQHVTVVLTGDGGDEVFLGYPWLAHPQRLRRMAAFARWVPGAPAVAGRLLRSKLGGTSLSLAVRAAGLNPSTLDRKKAMLQATLENRPGAEVYELVQAQNLREWLDPADQQQLGPATLWTRVRDWYPQHDWSALEARSPVEINGVLDLLTYLRDDVLVKVDRCTMAYGLEARSPLLDHRIVELGLSLPLSAKVSRQGRHKHILRAICERWIDRDLASLPKRGFGIAAPTASETGREPGAAWLATVEKVWARRWCPAVTGA